MWLTLFCAWLDYSAAVEVAVSCAGVWAPPLAGVPVGTAVSRLAYSDTVRTCVRAVVRTLSAPYSPGAPLKPLTCTDKCPDMSADLCPDVSGHRSDGGS